MSVVVGKKVGFKGVVLSIAMGFLFAFQWNVAKAQQIDRQGRDFFEAFQDAVDVLDFERLQDFMHFPFQTRYWIDDLDSLSDAEKVHGFVAVDEYDQYASEIFNGYVQDVVVGAGIHNLQEIDVEASGSYYKELAKAVDSGARMYELFRQFEDPDSGEENHVAFVFGKVNGQYKILSYHDKWPIKEVE